MARPRELLTLASIAEETGISYATLRNYAIKFGEEIPSEGSGRMTRYPRSAVKVFQRLRKESKPGRKPKQQPPEASVAVSPLLTPRPRIFAPPAPAPVPVRQEAPAAPAPRPAPVDLSRIEQELGAIRSFLGSIAKSLESLASEPRTAPPAPVAAPAPVAVVAPAPVPVAPPVQVAPEAVANSATSVRLPVPPMGREEKENLERTGQRRLHSLPKVMGQRGKRPD